MRILYVTGLWNGFDETVLNGAEPGNGLPAFWEPLNYMLERGFDVRFVSIEGSTIDKPIRSGDKRIGADNFIERVHYQGRVLQKMQAVSRLKKAVRRALKAQDYDFVYLHGPTAGSCQGVAESLGVPVGQRLYGTFLWRDIEKLGATLCRFLRRNEFLSFIQSKCFLLVTNDGSGGDLVYNKVTPNPPPFKFFHWINGVNRPDPDELKDFGALESTTELGKGAYIFYCARFDRWKRQDLAVRVLARLVESDLDIKLVFAGSDGDHYSDFRNEVRDLAAQLGVEDRLVFLGYISRRETLLLHHHALSSLFLFDMCNLGNALHEAIAAGGAVVVLNDPTMDDYIVEGENGYLCESFEEAARIVEKIWHEPQKRLALSRSAQEWSRTNLLTWQERAQKEVELIEMCVNERKN